MGGSGISIYTKNMICDSDIENIKKELNKEDMSILVCDICNNYIHIE